MCKPHGNRQPGPWTGSPPSALLCVGVLGLLLTSPHPLNTAEAAKQSSVATNRCEQCEEMPV